MLRRIAWSRCWPSSAAVPLAITNLTWTGSALPALTSDQFEIPKLFVSQALVLVAGAAWAWAVLRDGLRLRATPCCGRRSRS